MRGGSWRTSSAQRKKAPLPWGQRGHGSGHCESGPTFPELAASSELKAEPQRQLDNSGFPPAIGLAEILVAGGDRAALIVGGESGVEAPDLRMVEQVEDLAAEAS